ncbi:hypothetical protein [Xenorhabdus poinarii]|uniref:hypothetical protein n=1 Tax=Xenorhabdus poinarii TaxID=40577 RepID=UPI000B28E157|nr:hypothetical protein [Xenorhabdus poinarii]
MHDECLSAIFSVAILLIILIHHSSDNALKKRKAVILIALRFWSDSLCSFERLSISAY